MVQYLKKNLATKILPDKPSQIFTKVSTELLQSRRPPKLFANSQLEWTRSRC